ncbi:hypothetical protein LQ953_10445 [Sphingomonas sp. IC-56]|uniref:hypothetical protein n=1 Tax=Sphingomonas sp. IC-56 TaxID=2898529 RepID=UPI001E641484|nr:hypothetical protein [Sphingomonas sp. IC-56]MCD2324432.1 hypothetical protein [Sphingomonas sp. IC-56]
MKSLLLGASALAFSATAANAQVVAPLPANPAEASVKENNTTPVTEAGKATLGTALNARDRNASNSFGTWEGAAGSKVISTVAAGSLALKETGNKSVVDQDGDYNNADVNQQDGWKGWAVVKQDGDYNNAAIDQEDAKSGAVGASTMNAAFIQQVGGAQATKQSAKVYQSGSNLTTAVLQGGFVGDAGGSNTAVVDQKGTRNDVFIAQGVGSSATNQNNYAYVEQVFPPVNHNVDNRVGIQQEANGDARVYQQGSSTSGAYIVQGKGSDLDSKIVQGGYLNYAYTYQEVGALGTAESFIKQYGGGNEAFVNQSGTLTDGTSVAYQIGDNNSLLVQQTAAPVSVSHISQNGNFNVSTVRQ